MQIQAWARRGLSREICGYYDTQIFSSLILRPALPSFCSQISGVCVCVCLMNDKQRLLRLPLRAELSPRQTAASSAASLTNGVSRPKYKLCTVKISETCERQRGKLAPFDLRLRTFGLASELTARPRLWQ